MDDVTREAHALVAAVRAAAKVHDASWEALVPDSFTVNFAAEAVEEAAFADMAEAKRRLRDHICAVYGVSIRELSDLAVV